MSNVKNVILKKKIEGVIYDLLVKTTAEQVGYGDSTVQAKLAEALASIATLNGDDAGSVNKKISDAISGLASASDVITAIVASATNGAITITKNGATSDVTLKGVVTVPTYDAESRTLTMPYVDTDGTSKSVVMALGKDMVVKSGAYDTTSKKIVLTLTDDSTVEIPAAALVDVYTGETTNTVAVSVSADNKISAEVRVSAKEGNTVQVVNEEGKEGIYVPTPEQYDDSALSGRVGALETDNTTNKADIAKLKTDVATAQSTADDAKTEASNAKTVATTKSRVILSATQPADLTDNDLWLQEVTE